MSYDIRLRDPATGTTAQLEMMHHITGGTYVVGGTRDAWLNVTYNYGGHFKRIFGSNGIRTIYGMTGAASVPVLEAAIRQLGDDEDPDYWKPTEGNARRALKGLLILARACPDGEIGGTSLISPA